MEASTVEFEMHLPKCEAFREGSQRTRGDTDAWWKFYKEHFADQTPEIDP